jgi:tetratricopeptide (TPR) repeat protein
MEGSRSYRLLRFLAPLALGVAVFAAYAPTLDAEFVVWDDDDHIYENPYVIGTMGYWRAWESWRSQLFYPLTYTTNFVEWRLSGGEPWLFHLNNVLLHLADVVLLGLLGRRLGLRPAVAWAAAGLWGLNPLQVQTVAWAAERKNVLYVFFYLLALLSYARSVGDRERGGTGFFLLSLLLTVLSILSKPSAVTLPAAVLALHWALGHRFDARSVRRILAHFAVMSPFLAMHLAREELAAGAPLGTRVLIAARAVWWYVGAFLWPFGLAPTYPRWSVAEDPLPSIAALAALAAVLALALRFWRSVPRAYLFAAAFYAINIAPVIGIIWFPYLWYSLTADHLAYLGSAGLALLVAMAASDALGALRAPRPLAAALALLAVAGLALATRAQTALWHDTETLWRGTLRVDPESVIAHKNLGFALLQRGLADEASAHLEEVLRLRPGDPEALLNLGVVAAERGDLDRAVAFYAESLRNAPENAQAWSNLGIVAQRRGDVESAAAAYRRALELDPENARSHTNLGAALLDQGDVAGAIREHRAALRLDPDFAAAHHNLGIALLRAGRAGEAVGPLETADRLAPDDPGTLFELGVALGKSGRHAAAAERYRALLAIDPEHAAATNNLAASLLTLGDEAAAIVLFERALALAPDDPDSHRILATVLQRTGRTDRAIAVLERALATLDPPPPALAEQLASLRGAKAAPP